MHMITDKEIHMVGLVDKFKGQIVIRNESAAYYLVYKVKATNAKMFQASPWMGQLTPSQTLTIEVITK